jgi:high-affinity Fe2+/Pb2+ permease
MSNKQLRQVLRIGHIIEGVLIIAFIYSSSLRANDFYSGLIQFVVVPAIVISGIMLWQQARINKWRRQLKQEATDQA